MVGMEIRDKVNGLLQCPCAFGWSPAYLTTSILYTVTSHSSISGDGVAEELDSPAHMPRLV